MKKKEERCILMSTNGIHQCNRLAFHFGPCLFDKDSLVIGLIREFDTGAKRTGGEIEKYRYDLVPHSGIKEIARRYWVGHVLKGYAVDNWRKGIPFSAMINHAMEHFEKLKEAMSDEDDLRTPEGEHFKYLEEMLPHLGAIGWFVCCMSEFIKEQREDLDDRVAVIVRKKKESYSNDKTV